jgi:predicted ATPase/DNA-binding SARP family transcriptional activator
LLLRVLGPLEVSGRDGPVAIAAAKQRALLAALAVNRGKAVAAELLIDALWVENPPVSATKLLQVYVSQLRKVLPAGVEITTTTTGYRLDVDPDEVDAARFEQLLADGRAALAAGNAALASSTLGRALGMWRGPAFADVRYEEFARQEVERLEGLRTLALHERIEADLRLGRHEQIGGELRGLLADDPTNEPVAVQAIVASYRAGGAIAALDLYARVRQALEDELGEEPGAALAGLHERIVRRDPLLELQPASEPTTSLPSAPNPLVGRERELAELRALVDRPNVRLISLTGAGGSGKSRLALELARELEPKFANGAVLVELAALSEPDLIPATIAQALQLEPGPDALDTLIRSLAASEVLLVVDNLEHLREGASSLVRLLAAAPHLTILVTSRAVLHASGEHVYPVGPLNETDALTLFTDRALAHDPAFVLNETTRAQAISICRRVDGLPLPLELAAARVRALGIPTLDARLASRLTVLTGGPRDMPARQQTLRETLAWSVNLLEPGVADVLAALAVFPAGCTMAGAHEVAGATDEDLITLVDHHLVEAGDVAGERRYRLLETVREYAYELLGPRRESVERSLVRWMVGVIDEADLMHDPGPTSIGIRRVDAELDTLRDAFRHAAREVDPSNELALAAGAWRYWWIRGLLGEGRSILNGILARRGLVRTRSGIRTARAAASLAWSAGDQNSAARLAVEALDAAVQVDDGFEQAALHILLGVIATNADDFGGAVRHLTAAIALAEEAGEGDIANSAKMNLGIAYLATGRLNEARTYVSEVLDMRRTEGKLEGVGFARLNLGEIEFAAGSLEAAELHFAEALDAFRLVGFSVRVANALQGLAAVEVRTGRAESAARRLGSAAALLGASGWAADGTGLAPEATAAARAALGDDVFDRLFRQGLATPN